MECRVCETQHLVMNPVFDHLPQGRVQLRVSTYSVLTLPFLEIHFLANRLAPGGRVSCLNLFLVLNQPIKTCVVNQLQVDVEGQSPLLTVDSTSRDTICRSLLTSRLPVGGCTLTLVIVDYLHKNAGRISVCICVTATGPNKFGKREC